MRANGAPACAKMLHAEVAAAKLPKPRMNKTESRFAQWLDIQQKAGLIGWWEFQPFTFKLADDCRYTPDFAILKDGVETLVDVKGSKRKRSDGSVTYWCEEDAKIKIRVAASKWPWKRWVIVHPLPNGEWNEVRF